MIISDVRIKMLEGQNKLKAIASITIDECFVVHDLKVADGAKGLYVMMPNKKVNDNVYKDVAHPLDLQTRNYVQQTVLNAYLKLLSPVQE